MATDVPDGTKLLGVDGDMAQLQGPGGLTMSLPIATLSAQSQAQLGLGGGSGAAPGAAPGPGGQGGVTPGGDMGGSGYAPPQAAAPMSPPSLGGSGGGRAGLEQPQTVVPPQGGPPLTQRAPMAPALPTAPGVALPPAAPARTGGGGPADYDPTKDYAAASRDLGFDTEQAARAADVQTQAGAKRTGEEAQKQLAAMELAQRREAAVSQAYQDRMGDVMAQQALLAKTKEDPDHWFNSRSTPGKFGAAISLALGAFGQSLTGHNGSPINDFIAQDIEAQRNNYARAKESLAARSSDYGKLRDAGMRDQEAALALQDKMHDAAKEKIASFVTASSPHAAQLAAKALVDQQNQKQAEVKQQLTKGIWDIAHEKAATAEAYQTIATQRQQMEYQKQQRTMLANGQVPPELRGQAVYDPSGKKLLGLAPSADEAKEHRQMVGDSAALLSEIEEAKTLAAKFGSSSNKTQAGAAYKAKLDAIIGSLNSAQGIKQAVEDSQRKLYMDTFGNEGTTPTAATLSGLEGLASSLKTKVNARLRSAGPGMQAAYPEGEQANPDQQRTLAAAGVR